MYADSKGGCGSLMHKVYNWLCPYIRVRGQWHTAMGKGVRLGAQMGRLHLPGGLHLPLASPGLTMRLGEGRSHQVFTF